MKYIFLCNINKKLGFSFCRDEERLRDHTHCGVWTQLILQTHLYIWIYLVAHCTAVRIY